MFSAPNIRKALWNFHPEIQVRWSILVLETLTPKKLKSRDVTPECLTFRPHATYQNNLSSERPSCTCVFTSQISCKSRTFSMIGGKSRKVRLGSQLCMPSASVDLGVRSSERNVKKVWQAFEWSLWFGYQFPPCPYCRAREGGKKKFLIVCWNTEIMSHECHEVTCKCFQKVTWEFRW